MPKTLFNAWGIQRLDSKARHGKSQHENLGKGAGKFLIIASNKDLKYLILSFGY
jgi:hypothetical protein